MCLNKKALTIYIYIFESDLDNTENLLKQNVLFISNGS